MRSTRTGTPWGHRAPRVPRQLPPLDPSPGVDPLRELQAPLGVFSAAKWEVESGDDSSASFELRTRGVHLVTPPYVFSLFSVGHAIPKRPTARLG